MKSIEVDVKSKNPKDFEHALKRAFYLMELDSACGRISQAAQLMGSYAAGLLLGAVAYRIRPASVVIAVPLVSAIAFVTWFLRKEIAAFWISRKPKPLPDSLQKSMQFFQESVEECAPQRFPQEPSQN